jgi:hypothetical protein
MVKVFEVKRNKAHVVDGLEGHFVVTSSGELKITQTVNGELRDVIFTSERERCNIYLGKGDVLTIDNHSASGTLSVYLIGRS